MNKLTILAKQLRQNQTPQEQKLWNIIRNHKFHNLKFKRQQPIGKYIVDFLCKDIKLIIEIDGGQHNIQKISSQMPKEHNFYNLRVIK